MLYECETSDVSFPLLDFEPVDNNFLCKAVLKLHSKSSELNTIPTKLVKAHLGYFI